MQKDNGTGKNILNINEKKILKRIDVLKTYKLYIGGQFVRTESGKFYSPTLASGKKMANVCLASRKDFREAVVAARIVNRSWCDRAAMNRGQILYRMAEMLESRKAQFIDEIMLQGLNLAQATKETNSSIEQLVYYAGWCDKYQQIFSSVNPVASSHFNFSVPEPTGVVAIIAPQHSPLLGLVATISPVIAGGNTCVVLVSEKMPLSAITFAEVLNSSDLPGGVVNILTGSVDELVAQFVTHMDVNAIVYCETDVSIKKMIQEKATLNLKRTLFYDGKKLVEEENPNPYLILDTQEIKTTWHPIENISSAGGGY